MSSHASLAPAATGEQPATLLQHKCACGGEAAGLDGECEECRRAHALGLQPRLAVGASDDPLEREADRAAAQVLGADSASEVSPGIATPRISRQPERPAAATGQAPGSVGQALRSAGEPLPLPARAFFEPRFGHDFARVRVHHDATAADSAHDVAAHAYTVGQHIVFARGHYQPHTPSGRALLAHELAHVVQQRGAAEQPAEQALELGAPGDALEQDAHRAVQRLGAGGPAGVDGVLRRQRIQRFSVTEEAAGGCGICYGAVFGPLGTAEAGNAAHAIVQLAFVARFPRGRVELPFSSPTDENGRLDLAIVTRENGIPVRVQIGEIKAATPHGEREGMDDLDFYEDAVHDAFAVENPAVEVERLRTSIPVGRGLPMPDPLAASAGCLQQRLSVVMMRPGLFGYFCAPPFSEARRLCSCRPPRREREDVEVPVPVPAPRTVPQPHSVPGTPPVVDSVPEPRPEPQPHPTPEPETEPVPDTPPDNVVPFPGRPSPETEEEGAPQEDGEWVPQAARVGWLGAALTATSLLMRSALRNAPQAAGRRVTAYAQAFAVVALLVFYSGRAEARVGPGESPLESLLEAMRSDGIEVPPELRERLEHDEALRNALEQAAQTGDLSAAQQQIANQMMQAIAENPDAFSDEDLQVLASASEMASGGEVATQPTLEAMRAALEARRRGEPADAGGGGGDADTDADAAAEPAPAPTPAEPLPGISDELNQRLAANPEVRRLFDAMTRRGGSGPSVTDEVVERFLAIVPADLAGAEADRLIAGLGGVQGQTVDEILASLQAAVTTVRTPAGTEPEAEPSEDDAATPTPALPEPAPATAEAATPSEVGRRIAALLARSPTIGRILVPKTSLAVGQTVVTFVARQRGEYVVGAFVRLTPTQRLSDDSWRVTLHRSSWFNTSGLFVEQWPATDQTTELTYANP